MDIYGDLVRLCVDVAPCGVTLPSLVPRSRRSTTYYYYYYYYYYDYYYYHQHYYYKYYILYFCHDS